MESQDRIATLKGALVTALYFVVPFLIVFAIGKFGREVGLQPLMSKWYVLLSQAGYGLGEPIKLISDRLNIPFLTALLLGVVGSLAPCQLTTNASALAYVSQGMAAQGRGLRLAFLYMLGKITVYTAFGITAVSLGTNVMGQFIPSIAVFARKAIGPLLLITGLYMLGMISLRMSLGSRFSSYLESRSSRYGHHWGAFLLGVAFSLAFCPTLFLLFFGLVIPLGVSQAGGWVLPGLFAVGTTVPLLIPVALLSTVNSELADTYVRRAGRWGRYLRRAAGIVFLLAGINDTLVYWLI